MFGIPVLLAVGLLGLRSRYGERVGGFGRTVLLVGVVAGPAVSFIGIIGEAIFRLDWAWMAQFVGPGIMLVCLALFGIPVLSFRPLPRWNALPLLAGICYPALLIVALLPSIISGNSPGGGFRPGYLALITIQCVALFLLGYLLHGESGREAPSPLPAASAQ